MENKQPHIFLTGGSGFIGSRIVEELLAEDSPLKPSKITVFDIKAYQGVESELIHFVQGSVCDYEAVETSSKDADLVIHTAAIIDWGTKTKDEVLHINVDGTKNIIKACKTNNINYLVYTSSLDAVFTGFPLVDIDETQPYPETHHTVYCESKKLAELAVLEAHSSMLKTCILRPSDVYGEADPYHMDPLIDMAKSGFYVRLGNGTSTCQHVYVGNMAYAHVLAANALLTGNQKIENEVYFITDDTGHNFFHFFDNIVKGAGYKIFPKNAWIPKRLAYAIGSLSEGVAVLFRPIKHYNPKFSRFAVTYTCTDFTFSSKKALHDFNFRPKYATEEALKRTIGFYSKRK
ncbi:NAD-dependent epimerase/dehydratase family protein [Formosa maritima]|uniref:NAD-dependent epimerase/dehydratase family protein n=1 Tax=Formosa maritima TaxID=2592046 RepID=A0A5D0G7L3_9FLAO|nr:NAD-dependent epimerase/dehydratase family protein [Formosa maritima]TYA53822.1 NAD-dependent epimerase/dehydratase family protein [Formosa maritima]